MLQKVVHGRRVADCITAAIHLGFADVLADGPQSAEDLAARTGCHAPSVYRLLRALASEGVFARLEDGRFVNSPLSETLRAGAPGSLRSMALFVSDPAHVAAWSALASSVRTGAPAFEIVHGQQIFAYLAEHPDLGAHFNHAMTELSLQSAAAVADVYDFGALGTLADIGGGHGVVLSMILGRHPSLQGVLFDMPHVLAGAPALLAREGVADRVRIVGGNFFEDVPAVDAYLMKSILHDWSDGDCVRILENIRRAARPGTRLLLVELVIEPGDRPHPAKFGDLEMMVMTHGGRERTEAEWRALLERGGFSLKRVVPTPGPSMLLEAERI
jgi:hypothetical protein